MVKRELACRLDLSVLGCIGSSVQPLPVRQHHWLAIATGVRNRFISIYEMTAPLIGLRYNGPAAIRLSLKYVVGPGFGYER